MRRSFHKIAAPVTRTRQLHTGLPTPRPQRCFHQSTLSASPRKRNFFTSNQLLSNADGRPDPPEGTSPVDEAASRARLAGPAAKRKTARSPVAKKKIRASALTGKSTAGGAAAARGTSAAAAAAEDDADYTNTFRAICVARSFDMEAVQDILKVQGFNIDPDNAGLDSNDVVHARSWNNGDIFVFSSGTVVAWSVPTDAIVTLATKHLLGAAQFPHVNDLELEDLQFSVDETRDNCFIRDEEVVLGTRDYATHERKLDVTMAKVAFSMGLARSTKLAVLENKLDEFAENARPIAQTLADGSELSQSRQFIVKKTGEILSLRSQLNTYSELTDSLPDIFWDKESKIETYYNHISRILDVHPRIKQLNTKMDYASEAVSVMREMSSEKAGHRLEWIIIILITVEVLFEVRRIYREECLEGGGEKKAS
ncbi:hypothetical protein JX266_004596 [Neoarthrinium moseri]|nr:hypothetical protein JX266_004596 [Neoarthrinium moseri]